MNFLYLIFYGYLRLRFLDVETNPGQRRPVPAVCSLYRNPDLDDRIFDCLLASAAVQAENVRSSFLFVGDLNGNDLANPVFDGVGLAGFKRRANASLLT